MRAIKRMRRKPSLQISLSWSWIKKKRKKGEGWWVGKSQKGNELEILIRSLNRYSGYI